MSVFDQFTNKYSLSKTLRFELKPVGKTLDRMKEHMKYDENLQTFLKDQDIEDAYQVFKPLIDEIHEEFIVSSLESDEAKHIDFSSYLEAYKEKKDDKGEKALRKQIGDLYKEGESYLRENYETGLKWDEKKSLVDQKFELRWKVGSKDGKSAKIMESPDILYAAAAKVDKEGKKMQKHLKVFDGFFTYFSGFNQNRANYYEVDEEKATAIATRIVHENLPKFCDNSMQFFGYSKKDKNEKEIKFYRKDEYLGAYKYLKKQGKTTKIKDAESGEMIEACEIEEKYFDISYFNLCLSQKQIEKYNRIIGHYNLLINLYNQARIAEEKKGERTFKKLPHFKTLYKQIGCGKSKALFSSLKYDREADIKSEDKEGQQKDEILSVEALLKLANSAGKKYFRAGTNDNVVDTVPKFITWLKENSSDWSGFYWSGRAVNTISNKYFANWHTIIERIHGNHKEYNNVATYDKKREQPIKLRDVVELKGLFDLLDKSVDVSIERWWESFFKRGVWEGQKEWQFLEEKEEWESRLKIIKKAKTPSEALMGIFYLDMELHAKNFIAGSEDILALTSYKKEDNKKQIKAWMEEARSVNAMLRYFLVNENKTKGDIINGELTNIVKFLTGGEKGEVDWFGWYDMLRNYLTKEAKDKAKENKLKLNFENATLADGWDINKEATNNCVILKDDLDKKYLAVTRKDNNKIFEKNWSEGRGKNKKVTQNPLFSEEGDWLKMEYKQIAAPSGIGGFVRKCFNTAQQYGWRCPNSCLNKEGKIIIKNEEAKNVLSELIDCYKDFFDKYEKNGFKYREFNFQFKSSDEYQTLSEFFTDVENQGYKISFVAISKIKLDELIEGGRVYLFEIKNQDSNLGKKAEHKNNLHTIYWNAVFGDYDDKPKLNGGAELFYRKAISENEREVAKDKHGNDLKNKEGEKVLKNFRFCKEKFLFHCPITLNYKATGNSKSKYAISENNNRVNDIFSAGEIYFLGLDRGEKHLIYYSVVDQCGVLMQQGSLNIDLKDKNDKLRSIKKIKQVYNKTKQIWEKKEVECWNYNDLLDVAAANRDEARKNWQTIGNIKNLKEGYISQVVHEIVQKVTDKPTFIVLEDLSTGFKRGRQKIEKSVYQKFELALAKKLNFVVNKKAKIGEVGSVTRALQLTPPVQNYGDIENRKQVGIMLYTRANYTSQTDPITGWRKTIYLKSGPEETAYTKDGKVKSESVRDQIKRLFTDIGFDGRDYYFTYIDANTKKEWKLWSGKDGQDLVRYRGRRTGDKNIWETDRVSIKGNLDKIFTGFDKDKSLYVQVYDEGINITKCDDKHSAWESLRFMIDIIQQIRNSGGENVTDKNPKDDNFLLSPVRDEATGKHFDSRDYANVQNAQFPRDADANGAFNIARKGIIMNEHIKQWIEDGSKVGKGNKGSDLDLFISDEEWDLWLNKRDLWKDKLSYFASRSAKDKVKKKQRLGKK